MDGGREGQRGVRVGERGREGEGEIEEGKVEEGKERGRRGGSED